MTDKVEKPAKAEKPVVAKIEQNGVTRPTAGTATGDVWAVADTISANKKAPAERAEVVAQCISQGINEATAATQYGRWRKFNGVVTVKKPKLSDDEKVAAKAAAKAEKAAAKAAEEQAKADEKAAKAAEKEAAKAAKAAEKEAAKAAKAAAAAPAEPELAPAAN